MERIAVYVLRHQEYKNIAYTELMREQWKKVGVGFFRLSVAELSDSLKTMKTDEVILYDDRLIGPFYSTAKLLHSDETVSSSWWRLAGNAPLIGLRKEVWRREDVQAALQSMDIVSSLTALLGESPELYDTASLSDLTERPMLDEPFKMVENGCPFFEHEVFHRDYDEVIISNLGHQGKLLYNWLCQHAEEWMGPIWDFLLSNFHQVDIYRNLHLSYVLPSKASDHEKAIRMIRKKGLLLVMHLYYPDKFEESYACAARFPKETDVCITTNTLEKADQIRKKFETLGFNKLDVRVIANRGRDVSSLLVGAVDLLDEHEIVCFFHDKKTLQTKPGSIGLGFADKLIENMFGSADYVLNIVNLFADNERLGMLSPPAPHHSDYYFTQGLDWGPNYELTRDLAERLGFTVPIAPDKMPIAPLGTCFWFRSKALKPLYDVGWKYEDFPPEPNNVDGTLLHAIERIYPFAAVNAGYYPAYVLTDRWAKVEYSSLRYYVEGYNKVCFKHGIMSYQRNMRNELIRRLR